MIKSEAKCGNVFEAVCSILGTIFAKSLLLIAVGLAPHTRAEAPSDGTPGTPGPSPAVVDCVASYYGKNHHGKKTANGETFNMYKLTAAHRSLPFGTKVKVTNLSNDRSVIVRINDRGPYITGRSLDLSQAAAERLGMIRAGVVKVKMEILDNSTLPDNQPVQGITAR